MDIDEAMDYANAMQTNGRNRRPVDRVIETLADEVKRLRKALKESELKNPDGEKAKN